MRVFTLLSLLLVSCGDKDEPGEIDHDADGDGYAEEDGDCDDEDPAVNPGASELCDGADNDCDTLTDEDNAADALTYYYDADGDGYGNLSISATTCTQTDRYVLDNTDCDDDNSASYPGSEEVCDDADNDCDGETDEAPAIDARAWYLDADGDGYGIEEKSVVSCEQPAGYVHVEDTEGAEQDGDPTGFDCDDADPSINPGEAEVCDGGGVDEDCNGLVNGEDDQALGGLAWYLDADGDTYGDADVPMSACEQPFGYADDPDDCDDADASVNPGENEQCGDGDDDNCDGGVDDNPNSLYWIDWAVDADGDGYGNWSAPFVTQCAQPAGYAPAALTPDCYDADPAVFPGQIEICNGIDDDCDGVADEGC